MEPTLGFAGDALFGIAREGSRRVAVDVILTANVPLKYRFEAMPPLFHYLRRYAKRAL